MTVVLIVIDGLGARSVSPRVMPTLSAWGIRGMTRPEGATAVMCSSTYPNFASIVTGRPPEDHGIFTNLVVKDGAIRSAADVGPMVSTNLDERTEVVVGDHNLIGVMAASSARHHWPPSGVLPSDMALDAFGYLTDAAVTARVVEALQRRPQVLLVQLNGPDTVAHLFGPDSDEAIAAYRETDRCLVVIDQAVHWDEDLVLVTSDHDQETVSPSQRIDLGVVAERRGVDVTVIHEGTAAMLAGPGAPDTGWLEGMPGLESWAPAGPERWLVFSAPGWWFSEPDFPDFQGAHGGPRTRSTVAVAAGSARAIEAIRDPFMSTRLGAEEWFGLVERARSSF